MGLISRVSSRTYRTKLKIRIMTIKPSRAAGKIYYKDSTAKNCLNPSENEKSTPLNIQKFTNTDAGRPEVGQIRKYWGKVDDDNNEYIMTHGLKSVTSINAKDLLNPPMRNLFQDLQLEDAESIYKSKKAAPIGSISAPLAQVPDHFIQAGFGKRTERGEKAGQCINPPKTEQQVIEADKAGHELYVKTHNDYYVGEQINRNYDNSWNKEGTIFGVDTPHHNDGRMVYRSLRWPSSDTMEVADRFGNKKGKCKMSATKLVSKRVDEFRQRTQPQLGKVHDPINSTAGCTEPFGLSLKPDGCGAADVIRQRNKKNWLLGQDRKRGLLAVVRQHLKKANYHNFDTLKEAFKYYDKNNDGKIDIKELKSACYEFNLPIDDATLNLLMDTCSQSTNESRSIDYVHFANLLNWKNKMPVDDDIKLSKEQIIQQIDKAVTNHKTSSSCINATCGGIKTNEWHTYGVPTVRSDIPAPVIRRVSDHTNYGDELNAHGLLSPSIFTTHGVFESDFFEPRDKHEIKQLFTTIGVKMDNESWENCWNKAIEYQKSYNNGAKNTSFVKSACKNNVDKVSVECFRMVLDGVSSGGV